MTKREWQKAEYEAERRRDIFSAWLEYNSIRNRQISFAETYMGRASIKALGETIQECNRSDWMLRMALLALLFGICAAAVVLGATR